MFTDVFLFEDVEADFLLHSPLCGTRRLIGDDVGRAETPLHWIGGVWRAVWLACEPCVASSSSFGQALPADHRRIIAVHCPDILA